MKPPLKSPLSLITILVGGFSLFFSGCREKSGDSTANVETPESADLALQLEIEREMLAVERELLDLERVQLEEARNTALSEAEAAKAEAERARQASATGNSVTVPRDLVPPTSYAGGERPRTLSNAGSNYPSNNYQPNNYQPNNYQPVPSGQSYQGLGSDPDYSLFYEELRPHGAWFETPHYGYVWRPEVARRSRDWRPYTEGRWADTDMGWTWLSDEPFGWATYHYGRWTIVENLGWIWVPGSDWAPAWVSWRESNDYIGWAPLPPVTLYETRFDYGQRTDAVCGIPPYHYNFIPLVRFVEPVRRHCLPPVQNVQFVQYTTNVTYIHIHNQNIIVNGPRPEPLRSRFGRDRMPLLTLNRNAWSPNRGQSMAPRQQGSVLNFIAPRIAAVSSTQERPSHLEGRLDRLVPAHATAKVDGEIVKRFARGRARQEVLNSGPMVAEDGTINPATKTTETAAQPSRDVNEIRQTIAERESRIEELTKRREEVLATAEAAVPAPEQEATAPAVDASPATAAEGTQGGGSGRDSRISSGNGGQGRSGLPLGPRGAGESETPALVDQTGPATPEETLIENPPTTVPDLVGQTPIEAPSVTPDNTPDNRPGLPVDATPGSTQAVDPRNVPGRDSRISKGNSDVEARMQELRRRQEELISRSKGRDRVPTPGDGRVVPDGPSLSDSNDNNQVSTPAGVGATSTESPDAPATPNMPAVVTENPLSGGEPNLGNRRENGVRPGINDMSQERGRILSEQKARLEAERNRILEQAAAAKAQGEMQEQQLEQQKMQEQARAAAEAQGKMQEQQLEQQRMQEQARAAAEAQGKMQEQQLEQQKMQDQARAAAEAQGKMQEQQLEQQRMQEQARAAAEAQSRMQAQQQAQDQARAAAEAQGRMQEQQLEQQRMQEQARAAAEAQSRMQEQQLEQQRMQEQARAAAEAQSRMQEQQLEQQRMQEQARAAAEAQSRMQAQQAQEQARAAAEAQSRMQAQQAQEQARAAAEAQSRMQAQQQAQEQARAAAEAQSRMQAQQAQEQARAAAEAQRAQQAQEARDAAAGAGTR